MNKKIRIVLALCVAVICLAPVPVQSSELSAVDYAHQVEVQTLASNSLLTSSLLLFTGLLFHAVKTMSGKKGSLLRVGFVRPLCVAMKEYIQAHFATCVPATDPLYQEKWDRCARFVAGSWALIEALPDPRYTDVPAAQEHLARLLCAILGVGDEGASPFECEMIELGFITSCIKRFGEASRAAHSLESVLRRTPSFVSYMDETCEEFECLTQARSFEERSRILSNRFILLQQFLYRRLHAEGKKEWLGLVHHYMVMGVFSAKSLFESRGDEKLFLWTEFTPFDSEYNFFTSSYYQKAMEGYLEKEQRSFGVPLMSLEEVGGRTEDGTVVEIARMQRDCFNKSKASFMHRLLLAFASFDEWYMKKNGIDVQTGKS